MKTLRRVLGLEASDAAHRDVGKSWAGRFTGEQHLRANNALGSLQASVTMGEDEDKAVATATLLLRGVNRMRWAD